MKITTFILLSFILFLASCRKEQPATDEIVTDDPCECATEVSAEFDILEILGTHPWLPNERTPTDHILGDKNVEFKAKMENADSYKWYLGTEVLNTRSIVRYFDESLANENITISLAVRSQPNSYCFPDDDGYDSISKTFTVKPICGDSTLMEGWFRVALEGTTDSLDIGFDFRQSRVQPSPFVCNYVDVLNYNFQGDTLDHWTGGVKVYRNYRWVKMENSFTAVNPYNSFGFKAEMDMSNVYHLYITRGNPSFNSKTEAYPEIYAGRKL